MELLEGRRNVHELVLTGTVDDVPGTSASMNLFARDRLMEEGHSVSGALPQVEPDKDGQLHLQLKTLL